MIFEIHEIPKNRIFLKFQIKIEKKKKEIIDFISREDHGERKEITEIFEDFVRIRFTGKRKN